MAVEAENLLAEARQTLAEVIDRRTATVETAPEPQGWLQLGYRLGSGPLGGSWADSRKFVRKILYQNVDLKGGTGAGEGRLPL